ncbi:MAG: DUF6145 family protein, partial [Lachnospiraceae bacterium]|nr:DUF6145 family protein [Lachnospiraceae bacterium]
MSRESSGAPEKVILCAANAYDKKYYFNPSFEKMPDSVKDELHIICVLFTEEVGGIFTIAFDEEGEVIMETNAAAEDALYDEVSSGLLISKIRNTRQELFQSLQLFYRVFILKEDPSALLAEED